METTIISVASIITALGGVEFVKFLFNRRQQSRKSEIEAAHSEFSLAKESISFLHEEMKKNHDEIMHLQQEVLELTRDKSKLEAELSLKLCEKRGCTMREPQTGY